MKKLLLILLFIPLLGHSQGFFRYADPKDPNDKLFAKDKANHLLYGTYGTMMISGIFYEMKIPNYEIKAAAVSFAIGLSKEYFYDGYPSANDILANFVAVCIGSYIGRLSNERWNKPHRKVKVTVTNQIQ